MVSRIVVGALGAVLILIAACLGVKVPGGVPVSAYTIPAIVCFMGLAAVIAAVFFWPEAPILEPRQVEIKPNTPPTISYTPPHVPPPDLRIMR